MRDTVFMVDGDNHLHADFFGAGVNAVDVFINRLVSLNLTFKSDVRVAFDCGRSFRYDLLETYKGDRPEKDAILRGILMYAPDAVREAGFHVDQVEGFEADDVIATLTRESLLKNQRVVICSTDKDVRQLLVKGEVTILKKFKKQVDGPPEVEFYTADSLMEETGLTPRQFLELQALMGDATDGIPGAKGIGEKIGTELIKQFGTLRRLVDALFDMRMEDAVTLSPKRMESLKEFVLKVEDHLKLVTLRHDVPIAA